jgi:glycosyltransferase involved in cell wall biosynthesis
VRSGAALWFDLSSLVRHAGAASGIQRVASGLAIGLRDARPARSIRFCRFDKVQGFVPLDDADVDRALEGLGRAAEREPEVPGVVTRLRRRISTRSPLRSPFARGDTLFNPGFATYKPRSHAAVAALLERSDVRYVGFVYDLLPVLFPEWWTPDQQERYREWFVWTGLHAALMLCCSDSTRTDALRFFADATIATGPIETVGLGDELPRGLAAARADVHEPAAAARPFVLFVSTLEVRKNHRLLFQVWRRLLDAHGPERIPELVFVGKRGWLIDDFVTELEHARFLDGKIVWHERVDDAELARLYATCLFTVYPSLYEGWGLPVAEALSFGKYGVVSSASSLREVGRDFVDYHDPHDIAGATALIERAIFDASLRERKEQAIRERFRARSWQASAEEVLQRIERARDAVPDRVAARI